MSHADPVECFRKASCHKEASNLLYQVGIYQIIYNFYMII